MSRLKIFTVVGTRPEIIRLSRVLPLLDEVCEHRLVHTGQNFAYNLNDVFFDELALRPPDHRLGVRTDRLGQMLGDVLANFDALLEHDRPDAVLILGDTNSCLAGLVAKRRRVPLYHMEAGNRCFDENVPEEVNRRFIDHIADFNLVYTEHARRNLLAEGLPARRVHLTGSPMFEVMSHYRPVIERATILETLALEPDQYFLLSLHRQENVDDEERLRQALLAAEDLGAKFDLPVIASTHPRTQQRLEAIGALDSPTVRFLPAFGFLDYNKLQLSARCVLSDSGTISEESLILGFPAVTLRESIERPEALEAAGILTTGMTADGIVDGVDAALALHERGPRPLPFEYSIADTSRRVVNLVLATARLSNGWDGVREPKVFW